MSILDPLPEDSPWYRDHKFLAGKVYEMATHIGKLTAQLAATKKVIELAYELHTDYLEGLAADTWFDAKGKQRDFLQGVIDEIKALDAAVDVYRTHEPEGTHHG